MDLALLAPVALLLLALLLGRLERWLDASTPPPPPPEPRRWRRPRAARSGSVAVGAGRRLLAHRPRATARARPAAAGPAAAVPRAARRHLLRSRPRADR